MSTEDEKYQELLAKSKNLQMTIDKLRGDLAWAEEQMDIIDDELEALNNQ